jgi:hypothetical protein
MLLVLVLRCCAWVLGRHCCSVLCRILLHIFWLVHRCCCSWLLAGNYCRLLLLQALVACRSCRC